MPLEDAFLGRGWAFPPAFTAPPDPNQGTALDGGAVMTAGLADIEQSLQILLTTRLGERVLVPDFGCDLLEAVFEPLDATLEARLQDLVHTAILFHEPRIDPLAVTAAEVAEQPGLVLLTVEFRVRNTNSRHNFVFPFYKQEGSELSAFGAPVVPAVAAA